MQRLVPLLLAFVLLAGVAARAESQTDTTTRLLETRAEVEIHAARLPHEEGGECLRVLVRNISEDSVEVRLILRLIRRDGSTVERAASASLGPLAQAVGGSDSGSAPTLLACSPRKALRDHTVLIARLVNVSARTRVAAREQGRHGPLIGDAQGASPAVTLVRRPGGI